MKLFRKITGAFIAVTLLWAFSANVFATDNTVVESREKIGSYTYGLNGHYDETYTSHDNCYTEGDHYSVIDYDLKNMNNPPVILEQLHGIPVTCIRATFRHWDSNEGVLNPPVIPQFTNDISYAFSSSKFTTSPIIPNSVKNMSCAFIGNKRLATFPILPNGLKELNSTFKGCTSVDGTVELPNTITEIDRAFSDCTKLTQVPDISLLTELSSVEYAFLNCTTMIGGTDLPNSSGLTNIASMFYNCTSMTTPPSVIYDNVTNISNLFYRCENLSGTIDVRATLSMEKPLDFKSAFEGVASASGAELILNYTAQNEAVIDNIIASKTIVNNIKKGVLLPAELPPITPDPPIEDSEVEGTPPVVPDIDTTGGIIITDGKGKQDIIIEGIVEPINTIDIDVPLKLQFIIDADRNIHYTTNAKVISRSPAPLNIYAASVTVPTNAPILVSDNAFEDWNNLNVSQTANNIAISINNKNLAENNVILGGIGSGFDGAKNLPLNLSVLYGKQWVNTNQRIFNYSMNLEIGLAN